MCQISNNIFFDVSVWPVQELSEEEKMMIVLSEDFQRFVYHMAPMVERALAEDKDIYKDYTGGTDREDTG